METFLMHPLFMQLQNTNILCQQTVPDLASFQVYKSSRATLGDLSLDSIMASNIMRWIERRRIKCFASHVCIPDIEKKQLFVVDLAARIDDEDICFLVVHVSPTKCKLSVKKKLLSYCSLIKEQTLLVFKFEPRMIFINVWEKGVLRLLSCNIYTYDNYSISECICGTVIHIYIYIILLNISIHFLSFTDYSVIRNPHIFDSIINVHFVAPKHQFQPVP